MVDELLKEPVEATSVELACAFLTQVGGYLSNQFTKRKEIIGERMKQLKKILAEAKVEKRVQLLIKNLVQLEANDW